MKTIPLTRGKVAIVDDEDFELVSRYRWYAHPRGNTFYARTSIRIARGQWRKIRMHRLILSPSKDQQIDHVNRDGLDNRKANLRFCTHAQNMRNSFHPKRRAKIHSPYKGVVWHKHVRRWMAQISMHGKPKCLGYFSTDLDAARAYDNAAKVQYGSFARLNFPIA